LLSALRASATYKQLEPTDRLVDVECYAGYAVAKTTVVRTDPATVLFRYNTSTRVWQVIDGGTAEVCDGRVPATVRPHLKGC
jgi:hypothetical protein